METPQTENAIGWTKFITNDKAEADRYEAAGHRVDQYTYQVPGRGPVIAVTKYTIYPKKAEALDA